MEQKEEKSAGKQTNKFREKNDIENKVWKNNITLRWMRVQYEINKKNSCGILDLKLCNPVFWKL